MNKNTMIGILGGGIEGLEVARYFAHHQFPNIFLFDEREKLETELPLGVQFYGGKDYLEKAQKCDLVFRSPGIHIKKLQNLSGKITTTTKYFMDHCPCTIIGVTGTKGKGTTSTLITLMLKEAGYDVFLGGNIGQSPLSFLDSLKKTSFVVLEMSSFQLQDLTISPSIAVVLRVTSDHLDYHQDRQEYMEAKDSIVRYQKPGDLAIFNQDYDYTEHYFPLTKATKMMVTRQPQFSERGFELDPRYGIQQGAYLYQDKIFLVKQKGIKENFSSREAADFEVEYIDEVKNVALIGAHHLENVLPAVCVARNLKVPIPAIQKVLASFAGLPHRLEFVRKIQDVSYYNDSFSTTPETSIAATYAFQKPVLLIAGGSDKGADYSEWGEELIKNNNLKTVFLIGQMAVKMQTALELAFQKLFTEKNVKRIPVNVFRSETLEEAVKKSSEQAIAGDIVVMSPAAASFDMFRNYKDRGEKFRDLVNRM